MDYIYKYPRPMVTVDCILVNQQKQENEVLLIRRKNEPYKNLLAIPGGFVDVDEDLEEAALRELEEETGVNGIEIKQFKTYGKPNRDPRGRNISVVFYYLLNDITLKTQAGDDAKETLWVKESELQNLAFDHQEILMDFFRFLNK